MGKWTIRSKQYVYRSPWLTIRQDAVRTDKGIDIDDFYVLEYPTWVNVMAITDEGKYIIERQYRHGIGQEVYEICAGTCDEGEEPLDAAQRELLEETGFGGGKWSLLGKFAPNPNSMNNWCYSFLAEGVYKQQEPQQEPTENIELNLFDKKEVVHLLLNGEIAEGVMAAPLLRYFYEKEYKIK